MLLAKLFQGLSFFRKLASQTSDSGCRRPRSPAEALCGAADGSANNGSAGWTGRTCGRRLFTLEANEVQLVKIPLFLEVVEPRAARRGAGRAARPTAFAESSGASPPSSEGGVHLLVAARLLYAAASRLRPSSCVRRVSFAAKAAGSSSAGGGEFRAAEFLPDPRVGDPAPSPSRFR